MPRDRRRRKTATRRQRLERDDLKEISADDVLEQLRELLDYFGTDATRRLDARPKDSKSTKNSARRRYPHVAALGELLTAWHQDPSFLDRCGRPLALKMRGARRSFVSLARKSVPRANPRLLLAELERVGAVATDSSDLIRVQMRSLPVYGDRRLAMQHTFLSLYSFMRTLRHNLQSGPSNSNQLFHRVAVNGAFNIRDMPALKIRVKRHAQGFLESMDNWMARRPPSRSSYSKTNGSQVAIGVYLSVDRER